MSDSEDDQTPENTIEQRLDAAEVGITVPKPKRIYVRKTPLSEDGRSASSKLNVQKARETRAALAAQRKAVEANEYELQTSSDDDEAELVLERKKKPKLVTALEMRMMKLELTLEKLAIQEKQKKPKKVIEIQIKPEAKAPKAPRAVTLKERIFLDIQGLL